MKKRNKKTSVTRQVRVGTCEIVEPDTGLLKTVNKMEIREVDFNFNKIWLGHLLDVLDVIGNKKIAVMNWLLENRDHKTNKIHATQDIIMKELNVSQATVTGTFNALQEANALKKERNGVYILNPEVVWMGGNKDRLDILISYRNINEIDSEANENLPDESLEDLEKFMI